MAEYSILDHCPTCGDTLNPLPDSVTEQQARQALREVLIWYNQSPIREIQMASDVCCNQFPIRKIEAALSVME